MIYIRLLNAHTNYLFTTLLFIKLNTYVLICRTEIKHALHTFFFCVGLISKSFIKTAKDKASQTTTFSYIQFILMIILLFNF